MEMIGPHYAPLDAVTVVMNVLFSQILLDEDAMAGVETFIATVTASMGCIMQSDHFDLLKFLWLLYILH